VADLCSAQCDMHARMSPTSPTLATHSRQKTPCGTMAGGSTVLRKMTTRMKQLQEEMALESVTNIEFEESSRRSFEFLTGQVKTLKEAFNTLTDTFLQELEHLSGAISGEFYRLEEGILSQVGASEGQVEQLEKHTEQLEKHTEQLSKDLDAVLGVIPKIEDSMLRTNQHIQDRMEQVVMDTGNSARQSSTAIQLLEDKVSRVENELAEEVKRVEEELEQRFLKQQRSITKQLESMSKVFTTVQENTEKQTSHSFGSGTGGGPFGGGGYGGSSPHRDSPHRDRERDSPHRDRERASPHSQTRESPWPAGMRDNDRNPQRSSDRREPERDHERRQPSPRPLESFRDQDRDRDRRAPSPSSGGAPFRDLARDREPAWSDRGSTDKYSLRLPVDPHRPGSTHSASLRDNMRNVEKESSLRGGDTGSFRGGLDSYRDRLSSVPDSPRQSSRRGSEPGRADSPRQSDRRGNSPESQSQSLRTGGTGERLFQDPRQSRRDSQDR